MNVKMLIFRRVFETIRFMDAQVTIERFDKEDILLLRPLWEALFRHHGEIALHLGPMRTPDEAWRRRLKVYEETLKKPDSFIFVAKDGEKIVGYALCDVIDGSSSWETGDKMGELLTLSVLPEYRRKGVGKMLTEKAFSQFRQMGIDDIELEVVATNHDAIRFYERMGLKPFTVMYRGKIK